ncbi:hypothetical protein ACSFC1_06935 [Pseudothermotoga sp. U03pept]|uniref:hypothetical protein n=1 Tax=Pseudothermotoga sp. U03pept TaxID=3447012 RepID=UPI003EFE3CD6
MKGLKWLLLIAALIGILILSSCGSILTTIASVAHNIVEVTANNVDTTLRNLASWCDSQDILMLWYDFDNEPEDFNERMTVFESPEYPPVADKNVYLNNEYIGNYGTGLDQLDQIKNTISASKTTFSGTLIMYLRLDESLNWDLYIGEDRQAKVTKTNYVLVEFEKDTTNQVYKVTKVQVDRDWNAFVVPKNMSSITNKGFAFFRIDDDKVVDARVIYPIHP